MVLQGEIIEFSLPQLHPDRTAVVGAVQIHPQHLRFCPLPQPSLTRQLPLLGTSMPALAFDLLTQIVFQLDRQTGLTTAEALGHPLQIVAAHCALGQLAKQGNKGRHRKLELVGTG